MSLRNVGSKGGIILRVVSLQKLCTVVATRSRGGRAAGQGEGRASGVSGGRGRELEGWNRSGAGL